ncbi:hypothetical protein Acr_09g0002440 [Actinidia rufa]|uniref:SWIM-type domain-containing protein n=1 Tax=Actinidia rufa TaxID=165716 RepID=A0A7J0F515_9ERIC|nr:hypothetical protein Acr_09g0002440 [Actinidia rufa]
MIIPMVAEYGEHVSIKFICKYPHRRNRDVMIYKKLPINDDRTLQNVLNIPSRHLDHQHVEIYIVKEEGSTMNISRSHAAVSWADVHTYGELLTRRGDSSALGSFTQIFALGQSSRSTLAEEAPGLRMCSLFSQGECIEAGAASGSVDPVEHLVSLGETGTQDNEDANVFQSDNSDEDIDVLLTNEVNDDLDDDGHEDPNISEVLHDNSHIPFFTNLVGADDIVGGRDLYDHCPTWSDVISEFAKGMVFKDKDAVIRAYNWTVHQVRKFDEVIDEIKNLGMKSESAARAYRALCNEDPTKWTLAHDEEVVTSAAGMKGNHKHAVYLNPLSCDCGKWMIYHYPCSHMLAVCAKSGRQPCYLIDSKYRMDVYAHVYDTSFEPMVHEHYWAAYDGPKIILHPSRRRDPTSRCPTKRIHNEIDISRKRQNNHCGPMDNVSSPGPIDGTILTLQAHHRSTWIWKHGGTDALVCRRCDSGLYDEELDPRVLQYVLHVGFYGVHRLGPIRLDHALITAFVERWRLETNTFHLPECQDICMQAFGVIPPVEEIDSGRLRMSWLHRTFDVLPEHADDVSVQRHARAYILRLIGGLLLTDYSQTLVRVAYLPFLLDLDAAGACSWGSAVLAILYRSMCRATKIGQRQIAGALLLLQVHFPGGPWGARWRSRLRTTITSTHVVRVYRGQLDRLRPDEFIWRPYDAIIHELPDYCRFANDIWVSRSPLVGFEVVEWHLPDRVCKQFGLRQVVPEASNTSPALHVGVIDDTAMHYDDPYMVWHRCITRTLMGNPAHRPTSEYVEIGSTIEIASLQDMYDARDMCSRSLHALREHQRIGQPGVPDPPITMPPGFPATSPAMPPVFSSPSTSQHVLLPVVHAVCDDEEFDGYVDPLLVSGRQLEIPVSVEEIPKRKENFGASSSRSVPSDETVENQSSVIHVVLTYTDPVGNKWYVRKHCFVNKPILMHDTMGPVSHIFIGKASLCPPTGVTDDKCIRFLWEDLFDKRCEQEMYCRWHGLPYVSLRLGQLRFSVGDHLTARS